MNILVLDDDDKVCQVMQLMLSGHGWHCSVAKTYDEAVNLTLITKFDVAIIDLVLDEKHDGLDFIRYYRDKHPDIVVIIFTAYPYKLNYDDSKLANKVFEKPLDHTELIDWIKGKSMQGDMCFKHDNALRVLKEDIKEIKDTVIRNADRGQEMYNELCGPDGFLMRNEKRMGACEADVKDVKKSHAVTIGILKWAALTGIPSVLLAFGWLLFNIDKISKLMGD